MLTLLTLLTLIAPILAAVLVYGLVRRRLSRWEQRVEVPAFGRRTEASTAAKIAAARSEGERARQAA